MASFTYSGADSLMKQLDELSRIEFGDKLLYQGADIIVKRVKENIVRAGHVRSGSMLGNISYKRAIKTDKNGSRSVTIASMKKDGQGKEARFNAYKAFWANYGTSKQAGTRFWNNAEQAAEKEIEIANNELVEKYFKEKGLTDNA